MVTAEKASNDTRMKKEMAFSTFMNKMNVAEEMIKEYGFISEEEVEDELANI